MKKILYPLLLLIFSNFINAQNFENPKDWFLGIKSGNALSGVELIPNKEIYKIQLDKWLTTLSYSESTRRELWLVGGGNKSSEPDEDILLETDFENNSPKFQRMLKKAEVNRLKNSKMTLQMHLLKTYKFEKDKVEFDRYGEIKDVVLYKTITDINSDESKISFGTLKKMLSNVYGEPTRNKDDDSLYYVWGDSSVKLMLIAHLKDSYFAIIYNVKR